MGATVGRMDATLNSPEAKLTDPAPILIERLRVIDSHTAGEPTRVVLRDAGGPALVGASLAEKRRDFDQRFENFRTSVILEPRGSDVLVGALEVESSDSSCETGVIFFNNVGSLGMCGHGLIGFVVTLAHAGRLGPGSHRIDTPVGVVTATLEGANQVSFDNVPSWREAANIEIEVENYGSVRGDVAWGGNWFYLCGEHGIELQLSELTKLTDFSVKARAAIGCKYPLVDHIELTGPAADAENHGRNFVLCPGLAYDRSPCGTGTAAKIACLHADGKLSAGARWRQEGILGTVFEGEVRDVGEDGKVIPRVSGRAFVTAELELLFSSEDPFQTGIRP
jgi:4-hydroxyproline epimerase